MAGGKRHEDEEKGPERALFSMGKESNEAGQVYYHDVRQAAGKKRMKPDTKTDLDYDLTKHPLSVRSITLMDGPQVSPFLARYVM